MKSRAAWLAYIAVGMGVDLWRDHKHDGSTLSQATRDTFHTDHPLGRAAFLIAFAAFATWFPGHILEHPADREQREIDDDFARLAGQ